LADSALRDNQVTNATILIVEDHDSVRNSLHSWLSATFPDCRFLEAKSGEEGVDLACAEPPNIVLMDVGLPQMNGIEATRRIKARSPQIEVIMLTVYEDPQYKADAAAAGASAYILKRKIGSDLIPELARRLFNLQSS
jgi:DNA-binding NarL/FixJ family response regulator